MPLSLAEETASVVAIDLVDRFRDAGTRLAGEKNLAQPRVPAGRRDGAAVRAGPRSTCVLSHAVIEHVADADAYLAQCRRVLKPGGWMYLSTAPYLSFAGAHLPRLKVPMPLHLLLGRRIAFTTFRGPVAARAVDAARAGRRRTRSSSGAAQRRASTDDLLELVRVQRLRGQIARAGFTIAPRGAAPDRHVPPAAGPDSGAGCATAR